MPSKTQIARFSPLHLGQYLWPKRDEATFHYRAEKTNKRVNKAILRLHDPDDPIQRVVISQPPRTGKSIYTSRLHPTWYIGNHPDRNLLVTGYSSDLCEEFGGFARDMIDEHGEKLFGCSVSRKSYRQSNWKIVHPKANRQGGMRAVSIMGQLTGYGFNHVTIDDPYSNYEDAHSPTIRRKIWNEIGSTVETRMENPATMLIVATRWHPDDASGRFIAMAEGGDESILHINMPAIAEDDLYDEDGELFAKKDELLYPWQWDQKRLDDYRKSHGTYMFSALFQGNPTTPEGTFWEEALFLDVWFDEWVHTKYRIDTIDPAAGAEVTKGCDSAIVTCCTDYGSEYYVDCDLAPTGPVQTVQRYEEFLDRTIAEGAKMPDGLGIEHNATQVQSMLDKLEAMKRRRGWTFPIFEIPIKRDLGEELGTTNNKDIKIQTLDPYFRDKQFRFKRKSPGAAQLVNQCKFYGMNNKILVDGLDALEMNMEFYSQIYANLIRFD